MDDIKELDIFQNAEDNFIGETLNEIAQEMSNGFIQEEDNENFERQPVDFDCENLISSADDYDVTPSHRLEECETYLIELESSEAQEVCHVQGDTLNSKDSLQSELDAGSSTAGGNTSDVENDNGAKSAGSQYSQVSRIDLLEEIIDEAKTNKVLLFISPTFLYLDVIYNDISYVGEIVKVTLKSFLY